MPAPRLTSCVPWAAGDAVCRLSQVGNWNRERALYQAMCRTFAQPKFEPVHLQARALLFPRSPAQ